MDNCFLCELYPKGHSFTTNEQTFIDSDVSTNGYEIKYYLCAEGLRRDEWLFKGI